MSDTLKKLLAGLLAGGAITTGAFTAADRAACEYKFTTNDGTICLSSEEVRVVQEAVATTTWNSLQTWDELE